MKAAIHDAIHSIENEYDVTVLSARDYGSRARGLEDDDSDYDVMYVYVSSPIDYAMGKHHDTINDSGYGPDNVELRGWDLQKFIGNDAGILSSNPTAMEFASSPRRYYYLSDTRYMFNSVCGHARRNFTPYALMRHWRSMANSNYGKYIVDNGTTTDQTVKRVLNIVRALLSARYVEKYHELPPSHYQTLVSEVEHAINETVRDFAKGLGVMKVTGLGQLPIYFKQSPLKEWVKNEMNRHVEPDGHVDRHPDRDTVETHAENVIKTVLE